MPGHNASTTIPARLGSYWADRRVNHQRLAGAGFLGPRLRTEVKTNNRILIDTVSRNSLLTFSPIQRRKRPIPLSAATHGRNLFAAVTRVGLTMHRGCRFRNSPDRAILACGSCSRCRDEGGPRLRVFHPRPRGYKPNVCHIHDPLPSLCSILDPLSSGTCTLPPRSSYREDSRWRTDLLLRVVCASARTKGSRLWTR